MWWEQTWKISKTMFFRGSLSEHDSKTESRGTTTKRVIVHATHILSWVRFGYPYQIHKGSPRTDSSDFVRLRQTSSDFVRLRQRLSKDVPGAVDACSVVGPTQRFTQYKQTFGGGRHSRCLNHRSGRTSVRI